MPFSLKNIRVLFKKAYEARYLFIEVKWGEIEMSGMCSFAFEDRPS